ncbi:hypothetical protein ATE92_0578 [Ulvibacter sp. MAR_2010_11]|nr:hypothetical protein ATE92_0578 [Ulvibacter sp. MAR_2010_11]
MRLPGKALVGSLLIIGMLSSSFHTVVTDVYICKGNYSKKYHYKKDCRGLSNCSTDIYTVSLSEAKNIGRTLCGWED